ncbi:MAG: PepSY domain-containing protein [Bacteriovoracaceae bacterium]
MKVLGTILGLMMLTTVSAKVECTQESKDKWKDQEQFKKELEKTYKIKVFKVTEGNCYEIYGHNLENKKVEIYFNPVTGLPVKQRIE